MAHPASGVENVPTFVVATKGLHAEGPPTLFRSYQCEGHNASKCAIWEAGRATSAAPTFFKQIEIEIPRPGGTFVDGGFAHNNPAELALSEAQKLWTKTKRFCLVSVGTGRLGSIRVVEAAKGSGTETSQKKSKVFKWIPVTNSQAAKFASRTPGGLMALKRIGEVCVQLTTSSEPVHQRLLQLSMSADPEKIFPYHRFNVERDMQDIGLEEYDKMMEMMAHTAVYMEEGEGVAKRNSCVQDLMNPQAMECKYAYPISVKYNSYQAISRPLPEILHGCIPTKSAFQWSRRPSDRAQGETL